jgi:hypothetical protein
VRRILVVIAVLATVVVGNASGRADAAAPASNSATWSIVPSPNPVDSDNSQLSGVACSGSDFCMAVGSQETARGDQPLAEKWNGQAWKIVPTKAVAKDSYLNSVSCIGSQWCIAVGSQITRQAVESGLAEDWNGSSWSIVTVPLPVPGSTLGLDSVSCVSASWCTSVGGYAKAGVNAQDQPLAERWNGKSWTVEPSPNPNAENGSELDGLACTAMNACTAGGNYAYGDIDNSIFALRWDGKTWTKEDQPNPAGEGFNVDSGVSCTGVRVCTSVGLWTNGGNVSEPLAESWNGTSWSSQRVPHPKGNNDAALNGVACVRAVCVSVGDWSTSAGEGLPEYTLAERRVGIASQSLERRRLHREPVLRRCRFELERHRHADARRGLLGIVR